MSDSDKNLEIQITTRADLSGAKETEKQLEQAGEKAKLFAGHGREVREVTKELSREFPIAGTALKAFTNPIGAAISGVISLFSFAKKKLEEWNEEMDKANEKAAEPRAPAGQHAPQLTGQLDQQPSDAALQRARSHATENDNAILENQFELDQKSVDLPDQGKAAKDEAALAIHKALDRAVLPGGQYTGKDLEMDTDIRNHDALKEANYKPQFDGVSQKAQAFQAAFEKYIQDQGVSLDKLIALMLRSTNQNFSLADRVEFMERQMKLIESKVKTNQNGG